MLLNRTLTFIVAALMIVCFTATSLGKEIEGNARVNGTIFGTNVKLTTARFDGSILEIFEGDSWGQNPSLVIFLFDEAKSVAPNKSINIKRKSKNLSPHVHVRFEPKGSEKIQTKIFSKDYAMSIRFQKTKRGFLPARFELSEPKSNTKLDGFFFLKQGSSPNAIGQSGTGQSGTVRSGGGSGSRSR